MKKIRVVVCDDCESDRNEYINRCREISTKYDIPIEIKQYVNGNDLLFDLEEPKYYMTIDIIFLNIHMPGPNGIEVASKAREIGYKNLIIFITHSEEHYEPAFDVYGFNYITKGKEHTRERFEQVFLKACREAERRSRKVIVLSIAGQYKQMEISDIQYFKVKGNLIVVYYGDQCFEFISTLNKLENQLETEGFCRIQRAYLISLNYVESFNYYEATMRNGERLPVGRKYYKELKEKMDSLTKGI